MPRMSLRLKITLSAVVPVLVAGIGTAFYIRGAMGRILVQKGLQEAETVAQFLSESASPLIIDEDTVGLLQLLERYRSFPTVDFLVLADDQGKVILSTLPMDQASLVPQQKDREILELPEGTFLMRQSEILKGMLGTVFVGVNRDKLYGEISPIVMRVTGAILLFTLLTGVVVFLLTHNNLVRPLTRLAYAVEKASKGDFSEEIRFRTGDEIEVLSRSVERLKISLQKALERLKAEEGQ